MRHRLAMMHQNNHVEMDSAFAPLVRRLFRVWYDGIGSTTVTSGDATTLELVKLDPGLFSWTALDDDSDIPVEDVLGDGEDNEAQPFVVLESDQDQ